MSDRPLHDHDGDDHVRPADRLRARALTVDRGERFADRLDAVGHARRRRLRRQRAIGVAAAMLGAVVAALGVVLLDAVAAGPSVGVVTLALGAAVGAGAVVLLRWAARRAATRRGPEAWDAYLERHVLFGSPASDVHDADAPGRGDPHRSRGPFGG